MLGGRAPGVTPEGVALLAELDRKRRPVVLLCLEDLPMNYHRHHTICAPHFPKARHIFNGGWCYSVADVEANYAAYPEPLEIYPVDDRRLYALTEPDGCA